MWSVKWNSNGTMLGVATDDFSGRVIDFRNDSFVYPGEKCDECDYISIFLVVINHLNE